MQNLISIWRNRDHPNEMHQTLFLNDQDYKRLQEATEQKMKSIAEWQKKPRNWEEIDKQIQEMFDAHGQINPNKKVNHEITTMDKAQIQKMQDYNQKESLAVSEMMKYPISSEEMDRVIQEHYEVHNQVNPNKKTN